jgi:hypothetical protein
MAGGGARGTGRDQVPGVNIGLDQEPRGRRQQDQPAGYAGQLALQATDLLRQAAAGGLSPPLGPPAPGRRTRIGDTVSGPLNPCALRLPLSR